MAKWNGAGKLQQVQSGEIRYFRDWPALIRHLDEMLAAPTNSGQTSVTGDELQAGGQV